MTQVNTVVLMEQGALLESKKVLGNRMTIILSNVADHRNHRKREFRLTSELSYHIAVFFTIGNF